MILIAFHLFLLGNQLTVTLSLTQSYRDINLFIGEYKLISMMFNVIYNIC